MSAERRLAELGLVLPPLPEPSGTYLPGRIHGGLLWLAGQGPRDQQGHLAKGKVGADLSVTEANAHARLAGLTVLAAARKLLGSLDAVEAVVNLQGIVNATPDFTDHTKVMNGCSDLLVEVLGHAGHHPRASIGVGSLAQGISVEVVAVFALRQTRHSP
ncbi:RidA family protein [Niveispirillum sp.]|uniref:RidA family protein n=1 Tax=Niveispirillum sp. TaxID=1917217 RepID=UPI001B779EFA|nr:RidA family protein [Niveispirillum sp.]MBP7336538.1 RidA family protein [Niveispirillum sp.]